MRIAVAALLATSFWAVPRGGGYVRMPYPPTAGAAAPAEWMVQLMLKGEAVEGTPLAWNAQHVQLLGRDGWLWQFDPRRATDFHKTSGRFRSYSTSELRVILLRGLGEEYEVSGASHYLVAHPRGQRDRWAQRFEDLYRSFVHYFSVRGFKLAEPPFPLLGIVCKDQADFRRYASEQRAASRHWDIFNAPPRGGRVWYPHTPPTAGQAGVAGLYGLISNRIVLYDMQAHNDPQRWQENASVIIHEATHQTAFNTGVHSRWAPPPLWLAEGLATMFEAPGVYDSRHYTRRSDRINRGRFLAFKKAVEPDHRPESLKALIASDRRFQADPAAAYAEAWALSFYLVETQPGKYARYLALTAGRPPFTDYPPAQRASDFESVFGADWRMLQAQFLRFMAGVK
jgi:hypothetical protein